MRKATTNRENVEPVVRDTHLPVGLFGIIFGVMLLMSGVHIGIVVLFTVWNPGDVVKTLIPIIYWALISYGITAFVRKIIKKNYEEPLKMLAKATKEVSLGDFSVYVAPLHTLEKFDYVDVMILDFNKMVEELGSIETLKTDFISNISHEMKTPIAIIRNYGELLQAEDLSKEKRKEYGENIENASIRLSNLIMNILKLNKLENQRIIPEMEVYDVCRQVCECILQFEEALDDKEIELETEIDDEAYVMADKNLMELVWNNLISNAIKFSHKGGWIKLSQMANEQYIKITVEDNGCGMSSETIKHIFDKFYQGDTSHSTEGNGLGLALVKRVLDVMDGDIQVISKEGEGSSFTVTLPVVHKKQ